MGQQCTRHAPSFAFDAFSRRPLKYPLKDLQWKIVFIHATLPYRVFGLFFYYWYITLHHLCSKIIELH